MRIMHLFWHKDALGEKLKKVGLIKNDGEEKLFKIGMTY